MELRIGHGFDIHAFSDDPECRLVLGGVHIAGAQGLEGHSDADVIAHACADALLSPAGMKDIGVHFPDSDDRWRGADSMAMLSHTVELLKDARFRILNVDITVVAEQPKISPHRTAIEQSMTQTLGAQVTVKGKRAESLGAIGRSEGIAAFALALLELTEKVTVQ